MPVGKTKKKLRTAADVLSRLKWSTDEPTERVVFGYECRLDGPLEKAVEDYRTIDEGGDIPEHRITYFRNVDVSSSTERQILWDRQGRVDRIFHSGNGPKAPIAKETIDRVQRAIVNLRRLAEERESRRQEKAERRARRQRTTRSPTATNRTEIEATDSQSGDATGYRFNWSEAGWYDYVEDSATWNDARLDTTRQNVGTPGSKLKIVSWNVLFDRYEDSSTPSNSDDTIARWKLLISLLSETDADLILLQEATPKFVCLLCNEDWVRRHYSISAAPGQFCTIQPHGNMLMWKRNMLEPVSHCCSIFVLGDRCRKRSIVACFQFRGGSGSAFICANVHLPADARNNDGEILPRERARERELNHILGKVQLIESSLISKIGKKATVPIIMGDFNCDDRDSMLSNGCFSSPSSFFVDAWELVNEGRDGFTYNPETNIRAEKSTKGPRRIDRVYIRRNAPSSMPLHPLEGELIGANQEVPPSDHYGLSVSFDCHLNESATLYSENNLNQNIWAASAGSTGETLLALYLGTNKLGPIELFDSSSSLPIPHITLLHGFVELDGEESLLLASKAVENAVQHVLASMDTTDCTVPFNEGFLSVFEHRSSASVVAIPDTACEKGRWLRTLYKALRATFCKCDAQESRFRNGWTPHVTLNNFGTQAEARAEVAELTPNASWIRGCAYIPVKGIAVYKRSLVDGKFYALSSIPFELPTSNPVCCPARHFLVDAGASLTAHFSNSFKPFCSDMQRVCQAVIDDHSNGGYQASLQYYGSCVLDAFLPSVSDVDAVIVLTPKKDRNSVKISVSSFLGDVSCRLKSIHRRAKTRMRIGDAGGLALPFLTIKLNQSLPHVDLMVCLTTADGHPVDIKSAAALDSLHDSRYILARLGEHESTDIVEIYEGALRLCKLFAFRRQVYGSLGFLPGGGWAVWLTQTVCDGLASGELHLDSFKSVAKNSLSVFAHFVRATVRGWEDSKIVCLSKPNTGAQETMLKEQILARGTMAVLAPVSGGDFARNSTRSTVSTLLEELQRAATILTNSQGEVFDQADAVFCPLGLQEFLSSGDNDSSVLTLEIATAIKHIPVAEVKAWASCRLLSILVALEHTLGATTPIRPLSRPIRVHQKFVFAIRVKSTKKSLLSAFVEKRVEDLRADASLFLGDEEVGSNGGNVIRLSSYSPEQFQNIFAL